MTQRLHRRGARVAAMRPSRSREGERSGTCCRRVSIRSIRFVLLVAHTQLPSRSLSRSSARRYRDATVCRGSEVIWPISSKSARSRLLSTTTSRLASSSSWELLVDLSGGFVGLGDPLGRRALIEDRFVQGVGRAKSSALVTGGIADGREYIGSTDVLPFVGAQEPFKGILDGILSAGCTAGDGKGRG